MRSTRMPVAINQEAPPLRVDDTGTIRVGSSRISLDFVIEAFRLGHSPENIADEYPSMTLPEVYATIAYYLRHRAELDPYIEEGRKRVEELTRQIESEPGHKELRERLLKRAKERGLA